MSDFRKSWLEAFGFARKAWLREYPPSSVIERSGRTPQGTPPPRSQPQPPRANPQVNNPTTKEG